MSLAFCRCRSKLVEFELVELEPLRGEEYPAPSRPLFDAGSPARVGDGEGEGDGVAPIPLPLDV